MIYFIHYNTKINYQFFRNYFNENFNFSFRRPQIYVCLKCEELSIKLKNPHLNENSKKFGSLELIIHKRWASKFFSKAKEITEKCQEDGSTNCITIYSYKYNNFIYELRVQFFRFIFTLTLHTIITNYISLNNNNNNSIFHSNLRLLQKPHKSLKVSYWEIKENCFPTNCIFHWQTIYQIKFPLYV